MYINVLQHSVSVRAQLEVSAFHNFREVLTSNLACGMTRDSAVGVATRYWLDVPRIEYGWGEIFRIRPDRPWGPPSLLYPMVTGPFTGVKRAGRGVDHAEVKETVELYIFSPSGPLWLVIR